MENPLKTLFHWFIGLSGRVAIEDYKTLEQLVDVQDAHIKCLEGQVGHLISIIDDELTYCSKIVKDAQKKLPKSQCTK